MLSGIKNRRDLWKHFHYNEAEKKTQCQVLTEGKKKCGHKILGKNMLNLKRHIATHHKEIKVPHYHPPPLPTHPKGHSPTTRTDRPLLLECETGLPLASLRLLASPLQLTYAYIWQVIQQRDVRQYNRVEEFVATVTQTLPDLLSFKQTAQLLLGLRARIILELLQPQATPDPKTIQTLIKKLNVCHTKVDPEVQQCQTNFMVLVQMLLKNKAQSKLFFKDVFPVQYGPKFDTALQALIAGLVCKLEQLLPVPNLSQLGSMISTSMEACAQFIPDPGDLTTLLKPHEPNATLGKYAISSTVGDCVLSSLSYIHAVVEPPKSPERVENAAATSAASPASFSDTDDVIYMIRDSDEYQNVTESPTTLTDRLTRSCDDTAGHQEDAVETNIAAATPVASTSQEKTQEVSGTKEYTTIQDTEETEELQTTSVNPPDTPELQESPLMSIPLKTAHVSIQNDSASPNAVSTETSSAQKLQTQRVTLQQWVSQIATNSLSLPALPPIPPLKMRGGRAAPEKKGQKVKKKPKRPVDKFECKTCNKRFPYQSLLQDHERIHTGEKPYPCSACPKSFRTQGLLTNHQKLHSGIRPYSCGHCARGFISMASLRRHILVHLGQKPFYCEICNRGFTQSAYFRRHMECHTSQKSFTCKQCNKTFPTEFKLENHERWHTRDRPHMCERCGKRFLMPSMLKRHMGYHIGERQYLCSQCGKTFVYMSDLKRHQRYHGPKVKMPCPVCQKTFTKYTLRIHMRMHTQEKPYNCPICEKSFSQIGNLQVHKRLHTNERPYSCEVCGRTYKLSSHLNTHKKSHTSERPWTCDICEKGFAIPGTLKKHMLSHSRETTPGFSNKQRHKGKHKKPSMKIKFEVDGNEGY